MITKEQKEYYLKNSGLRCPFCHTDNVDGGPIDVDFDIISIRVKCHACGKEWQDIYKLVDIEES